MKRMLALGTMAVVLGGCAGIPSLPAALASSSWKNRPAADVIDHFGVPRQIDSIADKDLVVLVYHYDTSYTTREAMGTYTGPQNGQIVHTEYWGDVAHSANCEVRVAINRARQVDSLEARGGNCGSIELSPKK
ncbi:hypothetical protein [Achromobacter xylosoxidans]|uniref:hypothetical protein n=1 Tax=Alcaligenes xylosoxydans xylosoxydans TaxID=85698 RepID=UPI0006C4297F|nr:hypothetical protein [Achromobacter xylosoxidans]MCH1984805.1 hypothetical protein [Achromobacter xylosoxidans]MCH1992707.1 hypothetical protein [Achromobacter xylosoxidans]MCH4584472.1 hypothetical protein [Achromobacter xylosoxidans]OFL31440.1 hypothetical protein HMPREF2772_11220 [Achromobacter xylosoxidans]OFS31464.1 hypothetical protein HMPREF3069_29175 [Achromobacter xylosoxidans]